MALREMSLPMLLCGNAKPNRIGFVKRRELNIKPGNNSRKSKSTDHFWDCALRKLTPRSTLVRTTSGVSRTTFRLLLH